MDLWAAFARPSHQVSRLLAMATDWKRSPRLAPSDPDAPIYRSRQMPSLAERLGEAGVQKLITDYRSGTTAPELAVLHGCSLSTVKRMLRKHHVKL